MRLKQRVFAVGHVNQEDYKLIQCLKELNLRDDQKLLDVGCGYGSKLKLLEQFSFEQLGVEVNSEIVAANKKAGLKCVSVDEFESSKDQYDVLLFSHIIEHFAPDALLSFMNFYLDRLKSGGHVILITPLLTDRFFNDFDHIKPYYPTAIQMVFGQERAQVQYYSKHKLQIKDLWFRRSPLQFNLLPGIYVPKYCRLPNYLNLFMRILFRLTLGMISKRDAWLGVYQKK